MFKINLKVTASFALFRQVLSPAHKRQIARGIIKRVAIAVVDILVVTSSSFTRFNKFVASSVASCSLLSAR